MKKQDIERVAKERGLEIINITNGRNGYPRNTCKALSGFGSFAEAEAIAKENGTQPTVLRRKTGWKFWEATDKHDALRQSDEYTDRADCVVYRKGDDTSDLKDTGDFVRQMREDGTDEYVISQYADSCKAAAEAVSRLRDNEFLVLRNDNTFEVMDDEVTRYTDGDSQQWTIAIL